MIDYLMFGYEFNRILAVAGYEPLSVEEAASVHPLLSTAKDLPSSASLAESANQPLLSSGAAGGNSGASSPPESGS